MFQKLVLETKEIPYTINGKKVEIAVKKVIEGNQLIILNLFKTRGT